ncbi:lytic transglycosylase domain-containing protein [Pseudomonas aeruginosa]|uniref:lytic transglycosylase domain-containing protein n=1 Tax=Pseudomonas aeruginosa TaxID=287 RepID=UPI00069483F1|nr:lytic transglycosylase domain-containing protein [Pseudomonas aeruginosa]EKX0228206.1 lytic transglycosylase domain-containing protein [Pseudomonas aeruginosa]EKY0776137.1 lytic transglycosylase domain-containing protein [Pseudomonas aeruginosa]ELQ8317438.1 lytic transglycosylase domain-containing protein [Pseudomonas aeruginosa]ELT4612708.1 lytic transglycosylase domain-containing protein [Pseudomonas aeruginosa]ELT8145171.1 lytic transglycosylase domain-containing protein [Pseudomonas aer
MLVAAFTMPALQAAEDEQALYDFLFSAPSAPMAAQRNALSSLGGDSATPWRSDQLQELKGAFKAFDEQPAQQARPPASDDGDGAIRLWDLAEEPQAALVVPASMAAKAAPYARLIQRYAHQVRMSPTLVTLMIHEESRFNPTAVSPKGAKGLMQLMDAVSEELGVDPFDPESNIRGGTKHLARLYRAFGGNLKLAIAAYNAGEGAVRKYGGIPPYEETQNYVSRIMAGLAAAEARAL